MLAGASTPSSCRGLAEHLYPASELLHDGRKRIALLRGPLVGESLPYLPKRLLLLPDHRLVDGGKDMIELDDPPLLHLDRELGVVEAMLEGQLDVVSQQHRDAARENGLEEPHAPELPPSWGQAEDGPEQLLVVRRAVDPVAHQPSLHPTEPPEEELPHSERVVLVVGHRLH
eukprot:760006-Hanusia_phi.AAC.1